MIRLAWRQFRVQALAVYTILAAIAVVLAITGPRLAHRYHADLALCRAQGSNCGTLMNAFVTDFHGLQAGLDVAVLVLPGLIGIFWGAPLVARELETGTFRMVWTQSVTRNRWMITKLAVAGLAGMVATGLLSLMVTWWSSPVDQVNLNRLTPAMFGERGLAPVGYAAFAFALGVLAGVLIRRTLPAMAATLAAFIGARLAVTYWLRPRIFTPVRVVSPLTAPVGPGASAGYGGLPSAADWVVSSQTINGAGRVIGTNGSVGPNGAGPMFAYDHGVLTLVGVGPCPGGSGSRIAVTDPRPGLAAHAQAGRALQSCLDALHIRQVISYQPIGRYWPLQWSELGVFLAVAVLAAAVCVWRVRRHA
jgi:hypothetical protein